MSKITRAQLRKLLIQEVYVPSWIKKQAELAKDPMNWVGGLPRKVKNLDLQFTGMGAPARSAPAPSKTKPETDGCIYTITDLKRTVAPGDAYETIFFNISGEVDKEKLGLFSDSYKCALPKIEIKKGQQLYRDNEALNTYVLTIDPKGNSSLKIKLDPTKDARDANKNGKNPFSKGKFSIIDSIAIQFRGKSDSQGVFAGVLLDDAIRNKVHTRRLDLEPSFVIEKLGYNEFKAELRFGNLKKLKPKIKEEEKPDQEQKEEGSFKFFKSLADGAGVTPQEAEKLLDDGPEPEEPKTVSSGESKQAKTKTKPATPKKKEKAPAVPAKKSTVNNWNSYAKISDDHGDMAAQWIIVSDDEAAPYKEFVKWYEKFKSTGKTGTPLNYVGKFKGKSFGKNADFNPSEIADVLKQVKDRGHKIGIVKNESRQFIGKVITENELRNLVAQKILENSVNENKTEFKFSKKVVAKLNDKDFESILKRVYSRFKDKLTSEKLEACRIGIFQVANENYKDTDQRTLQYFSSTIMALNNCMNHRTEPGTYLNVPTFLKEVDQYADKCLELLEDLAWFPNSGIPDVKTRFKEDNVTGEFHDTIKSIKKLAKSLRSEMTFVLGIKKDKAEKRAREEANKSQQVATITPETPSPQSSSPVTTKSSSGPKSYKYGNYNFTEDIFDQNHKPLTDENIASGTAAVNDPRWESSLSKLVEDMDGVNLTCDQSGGCHDGEFYILGGRCFLALPGKYNSGYRSIRFVPVGNVGGKITVLKNVHYSNSPNHNYVESGSKNNLLYKLLKKTYRRINKDDRPKRKKYASTPFRNKEEGDAFRRWARSQPGEIGAAAKAKSGTFTIGGKRVKAFDLDDSGAYNNRYIRRAYSILGKKYESEKDSKPRRKAKPKKQTKSYNWKPGEWEQTFESLQRMAFFEKDEKLQQAFNKMLEWLVVNDLEKFKEAIADKGIRDARNEKYWKQSENYQAALAAIDIVTGF